MFYIVLLILFGVLFLVAELVLLPGISIGGTLSLICYGSSIYLAFHNYGPAAGCLVIAAVAVLSLATTLLSLRAKTWLRFSLRQETRSSSMPEPSEELRIGQQGRTLSRLSPMGKVEIEGRTYEAKSRGTYINQQRPVEVVGFENFSVIVKEIN